MVSKEEKILLIARESAQASQKDTDDIARAIRQICNNCIVAPLIDIDKDLTTFDIQALFIKIRAISVSNIVKLTYLDNEDSNEYSFDVDLNQVTVNGLAPLSAQIKITDNLVMNMKYPASAIFIDPEYVAVDDPTDVLLLNTIDTVVDASGIHKFSESTKDEQVAFLGDLPIETRQAAIQFLQKLPSLYYQIKYTNSKGTERSIELKSLADFFIL